MKTLKDKISYILNNDKEMTVKEVYSEYLKEFPEEVIKKVNKYPDIKLGLAQLRAEIGSILSTNKSFSKISKYKLK